MSLAVKRQNFLVKRTLNRWQDAYRYEVSDQGKRKQLYCLFFSDKDDLTIFLNGTQNLMALKAEYYLGIEEIKSFEKNVNIKKYNLQILTEFGKTLLVDNLKRISDRSMKLSIRETALLLKTFINILNDMLYLRENESLFIYLQEIWQCDLSNAIYLNDEFEVKVNLLPEMTKFHEIKWKSLLAPFNGSIPAIFEKIVSKFIKILCPNLPIKKEKQELLNSLPDIASNIGLHFNDIFLIPPNLMNLIVGLAEISSVNYEEKIRDLYYIVMEDEFATYLKFNLTSKYDYEKKFPKTSLLLDSELSFYKFLRNVGLEFVVQLYFPLALEDPKEEVNLDKIESLIIHKVDISIIVLYDIIRLKFPALKKLSLKACGVTGDSLKVLFLWDAIENLETLDFLGNEMHYNLIAEPGCIKIAECEKLKNLKELNLTCCRVNDTALAAMAQSQYLDNLETLDISINKQITKEGLKAINESPGLKNLGKLKLMSNLIGNEGVEELLKPSPFPKKYKELNLCECGLSVDSLNLLILSECTETLEALFLDANDFSAIQDWRASKQLPVLNKLSVQACSLRDPQFEALFSMFKPENMTYLDVSFNGQLVLDFNDIKKLKNLKDLLIEATSVDEKMFEKLAEDDEPHPIQSLSIKRGVEFSPIFERIAKTKKFPNLNSIAADRVSKFQMALLFAYLPFSETSDSLEVISLFGVTIDFLFFKHSLNHTLYLNNLCELKLINIMESGNQMLIEVAKCGKMSKLRVLEMMSCAVDDKALLTLTKKAKLDNLQRLNLCWNSLSFQAIRKFLVSTTCSRLEYFDVTRGPMRPVRLNQRLMRYQKKYRKELIFEIDLGATLQA